MPVVENPDGTLWLDVNDLSEVDAVRARLTELGVPVTALESDTTCRSAVEEVGWSELYPKLCPGTARSPGSSSSQPRSRKGTRFSLESTRSLGLGTIARS